MYVGSSPRRLFSCPVFLLACALAGCAGSGGSGDSAKDSVSGKVTLDGQPVAGQVIFVGSDKKEATALITKEGEYRIINPPKGEVQVFVKGQSSANPAGAGKGAAKAPEMPGMPVAGVAPPAKYATAAGGLKFTVTGGEQKYDIPLSP